MKKERFLLSVDPLKVDNQDSVDAFMMKVKASGLVNMENIHILPYVRMVIADCDKKTAEKLELIGAKIAPW